MFQPVNLTSACTLYFCKGRIEKQYLASQQESTLPVWKEKNQDSGFFVPLACLKSALGTSCYFWAFSQVMPKEVSSSNYGIYLGFFHHM